jgi:exopolyphosphatase/guanosine-5'-triphosphate,3'-diphosphate pyrophosphatase
MNSPVVAPEIFAGGTSLADNRVAVVDIGSNSVRLVVYDLGSRVLVPQINEKVFCGLGRQLATTGKLDPDGRQLATVALEHFHAMIKRSHVRRVEAVATAAVRDAQDGPDFKIHAENRLGVPIRVLDGDEEARYSALGVIAGIPDATGIVGDLGGGSLELVEVRDKKITNRATLPLGPLRLLGLDLGSNRAIKDHIDRELKRVAWTRKLVQPTLYLVGGSWRSLARLHLKQGGERHGIKIPHQYTLRASEARDLKNFVPGRKQLDRLEDSDRQRFEGLPTAALVLERLLDHTGAAQVVVSAYGLREGIVAEIQGPEFLAQDPLLAGAQELCRQMARDAALASELIQFSAPLFTAEAPAERRLRNAACWLADIAWRVHPEYRANFAFGLIVGLQFAGLDHEARVFLASVLFERYPGGEEFEDVKRIRASIDENLRARARILGRTLRLGMTLSGGCAGTLGQCGLILRKTKIDINAPKPLRVLLDETIEKRKEAIEDALERAQGSPQFGEPR